jgi:cobalt/nickel transport system permease protein
MLPLFPPLFAMHIGDGFLTPPWCIGGYIVAGLLALYGAWRIREEEIPQLAVLTAVFFLTALIHVPVPAGPRTHLLLNGLLGVVLGRRAILAIIIGLFLQSSLSIMEGVGFSTLGVNACVMALPAFLAWGLFALLHRLPFHREVWFRAGVVGLSTLLFLLSLCYAIALLVENWRNDTTTVNLSLANDLTFHPITLLAALLLAALAAWVERRLDHAAEFPLGLLLGEVAVLATILLNGLALLWGGMQNWNRLVLITFVVHLPLAVIEGIVLGFTVGFLARVRPQLLYGYRPAQRFSPPLTAVALLLAPLALFAVPGAAHAHRLEADYRVLPDKRVQVESWFDITGDSPQGAKVVVYHADGSVLTEGQIDAKGMFVFSFDKAEQLRVIVDAGQGHGKELHIPASALAKAAPSSDEETNSGTEATPQPFANRSSQVSLRDVLIGVGFILALGAFVLSVWNTILLLELRRQRKEPIPSVLPALPLLTRADAITEIPPQLSEPEA